MDWRGLGWWRPAVGLLAWAALSHLHPALLGVPAWPG
jgi:hypothetical protein